MFNYLRKKKQTATEPNGIPYWIIRNSAHCLLLSRTHIFQLPMSSAKFPTQWKLSCIKPVPKCSNPVNFKTSRPITLTINLARVLERLVYDTYCACVYNSSLKINRFGFRKRTITTFRETIHPLSAIQLKKRKHYQDYSSIRKSIQDKNLVLNKAKTHELLLQLTRIPATH